MPEKTYSRTAISTDKAIILGVSDWPYVVCLETNKCKIISNDLSTQHSNCCSKKGKWKKKEQVQREKWERRMSKGSNGNKWSWKEPWNRNLQFIILLSSPCCPHTLKTSDSPPGGPFILSAPVCCWRQLSDRSSQEERHFALLYLYRFENIQRQKILFRLNYPQKACRDLSDFEGREVTYWEDSDKITQKIGLYGNGLPAYPVTVMLSPENSGCGF